MLSFLNFILGIITVPTAIIYAVKLVKRKQRQKSLDMEDTEIPHKMCVLYGEVIDITEHKESGMSRIEVRDKNGITQYGFSSVSVKRLEALYSGRGYVQVPVMK